jgi:hypothetical protein
LGYENSEWNETQEWDIEVVGPSTAPERLRVHHPKFLSPVQCIGTSTMGQYSRMEQYNQILM